MNNVNARRNLKLVVSNPVLLGDVSPLGFGNKWHASGSLTLGYVPKPLLDRLNRLDRAVGVVLEFPKCRLGNTKRKRAAAAGARKARNAGAKSLDVLVDCAHAGDVCADNCACQQGSQNFASEQVAARVYPVLMTTNPRILLKDWMAQHRISGRGWTTKAGLTENTLRGYLKGDVDSLTVANTRKLAKAVGVPFSILVEYTGGDVDNDRVPSLPAPSPDASDEESSIQAIQSLAAAASKK